MGGKKTVGEQLNSSHYRLHLKIVCRQPLTKLCLLESYLNSGFARMSDVASCHQVKLTVFMFS